VTQQRRTAETQRDKRNKGLLLFFSIAAAIVVVVVLVVVTSQSNQESPYTQEEMQKFWDENLNSLIMEQLTFGGHSNSTVNEIVQGRFHLINERLDKPQFDYRIIPNYGVYEDVPMITFYENETIVIGFIIPDIMDIFYETQADQSSALRDLFKNAITIGFMHELDHIVFDPIESTSTLEGRVTSESIAWQKQLSQWNCC